jgi:hypothetical protein
MTEGHGAVGALVKVLRAWLPLLQRDVPGFDSSDFADKPEVPDDVLEDAGRMHDLLTDFVTDDGEPLPYRDACLGQLDPAMAAASKEWRTGCQQSWRRGGHSMQDDPRLSR